jgi:hypothetical protein
MTEPLEIKRTSATLVSFTLPEQEITFLTGRKFTVPESRLTLVASESGYEQTYQALDNALGLLRELYDVGLYDPAALRVLLTAYGHATRRTTPLGRTVQDQTGTL